jgi:hypothetical protein
MTELQKLWHLLDGNGINIRARFIRSAADVWADRLMRHLDIDDWQLNPVLFAELNSRFDPTVAIDSRRSSTDSYPAATQDG